MSRLRVARTRLVLFGAIAVLLAGCWPARLVDRPGIIGAVVSAADGKPVAGATVRLARDAGFTVEPGSEVVTSRIGTFQLDPIHSWGLYSPLGDYLYAHGVVEVDAEVRGGADRRGLAANRTRETQCRRYRVEAVLSFGLAA